MRLPFLLLVLLLAVSLRSEAYVLEGQQWPNGNIVMNLQLSPTTYPLPTGGLADGSANWNIVCENALADWNQYLLNVTFTFNLNAGTPSAPDHVNSVFFSNTVYGQSFGSGTLGITVRYYNSSTNRTTESDTVINTAFQWDSYRGNLRPNAQDTAYIFDIRRVLDHELGHNLGLNHPDLATPQQSVTAIMNSITSDLDHIELDDISGVWSMYGHKSPSVPVNVVASPAAGGTITGGGNLGVNTTQTLTAIPAAGYTFVDWSDSVGTASRSITVPVGGATYTANFVSALDNWSISTAAANGTVVQYRSLLLVNGTFMAFGTNGMSTSSDGVTWTAHVPSNQQTYNDAKGTIAYGGGVFVSVGAAGGIWSSPDGITWTDRSPGIVGDFTAVTYGNGKFVAVGVPQNTGELALIVTSADGINWTQQTQGVTGFASLGNVIYANGIFLATSGGYGGYALTSPDGVSWTMQSVAGIFKFSGVTYGQGHFFAGVNFGYVASSTDGLNWTVDTSNYYATDVNVGYGNGVFLVWYDYHLVTSTDGITWTQRGLGNSNTNYDFVYGHGRFVDAGQYVSADEDGLTYSGPVPALTTVLPSITTATTRSTVANASFSYQISATSTPLAFNAAGLPQGLAINMQTGLISGTPTVTGTFPVTLFATNDAGSGTATLLLTVTAGATPQLFTDWATAHNVTGGMSATPRNDGIPNLLKYLYDIDPTVPVTAAARASSLPVAATASAGTELTLTFPENKIVENVGVAVQTSTDLALWSTPSGASITPTGTINAKGDPIMVARVPVTASTQFIRLVVTPQ